ncbi:MAG: transporter [Cryomorphaceae bacterium]
MFKVVLVFVITALQVSQGFAQYGEVIRTARPGISVGPFTVGARVLQVQSGVQFTTRENFIASRQAFNQVNVVRFGLTERFEVGVGAAYQSDVLDIAGYETSRNGLSAMSVRMRSCLHVGEGLVPTVGLQVNLAFPIVSEDYRAEHVAPRIILMTGQRLGERFGIRSNWSLGWDGNTPEPSAFYTFFADYLATNTIRVFVEHFASVREGEWEGGFDGGMGYLINSDLQLDVSGGYGGLNRLDTEWFVAGGVSWRMRFNKREKNT